MKSIIAICLILGMIGSAYAAASTNSAGTFNKGPFQVLSAASGGNTTDIASWGTGNTAAASAAATFDSTSAKFGPGADNATIWLYAADFTTGPAASAKAYYFISRKINATQITNGSTNTAAEESVLASNGGLLATLTWTGTTPLKTKIGVAPGYALLGLAETLSTSAVQLSLYLISGTSATPKVLATSSTTVAYAAGTPVTTGYTYAYIPLAVWYEDSAYYCLYESQTTTTTATATTAATLMIQGFNSSALIYTTPVTVATVASTVTLGTATITGAVAGGSNYTNSTYWLVTYLDGTTTTKGYTVTKDGKTSTSAFSLANTGTGSDAIVYSPAGIVPGNNNTYGFLLGVATGSTPTYNLTILLNGSTTPATTGLTFGTPTGAIGGGGFSYVDGFAILAAVPTATSPAATTYYLNAYFSNNTANTTAYTTQQSLGSYGTASFAPSIFVDVNGSVWFGYGTTSDTSATPQPIATAYIARLIENTRAYYATAAGNVLVTIAAMLSFVIASLFMF